MAMVVILTTTMLANKGANVSKASRRNGTKASELAADVKQWLRPRYFVATMLALGLAFAAGAHSLAQATEGTILTLGPVGQYANGGLVQVAGNVRFGEPIRNPDRIVAAARDAIALVPLNAYAASFIGLSLDQKGDTDGARKAMNVAILITRRDPTAQLWLGQEAIKRGDDLDGILRRYDLVMRTVPAARPAMLAAISQMLGNAQMRGALKPYIRADNKWFEGFALIAAEKPVSAVGFARMLLLPSKPLPDSAPLRNAYASTLRQVAAERRYGLMDQLYPRLPGAPKGALQSAALQREKVAEYPPATWWLVTEPELGSSVTGRGADQQLELYAANGTGGIAARKILLLQPGIYRLSWRLEENSNNPGAQIRVVVSCADASGDRVIASHADEARPLKNGEDVGPALTSRMQFTVATTDCKALWLDIQTTGGKSRDESRWLLSGMSVAPLSAV